MNQVYTFPVWHIFINILCKRIQVLVTAMGKTQLETMYTPSCRNKVYTELIYVYLT